MEKDLSYVTEVQYDGITGEYYVEFKREMLQALDWRVGDDLEWIVEDKKYMLINRTKEERDRGNNDDSL